MQCPFGVPEVDRYKCQAHDNGRYGEKLPNQDNLLDVVSVEGVCRNNQEHGCRGNPHQKCEVCDIGAPTDLVTEIGDNEPILKLYGPCPQSDENGKNQGENPEIIAA